MNKCGLIVGGVFAAIAGAAGVIFGGIYLAQGPDAHCEYYSGYYNYYEDCSGLSYVTMGVLQLIGAVCMIGAAVCTFIFTCSARFQKYHAENNGGDDDGDRKPRDDLTQTANFDVVIPSSGKKSSKGNKKTQKDDGTAISNLSTSSTTTKTITHMPDGSIKTEVMTILPDGSKQITISTAPAAIDEVDDTSVDKDFDASYKV
jgi:hypothetical protein